jgi:hypothetical protein
MQKNQFWPFEPDPEGEIYENPAWDLPGYRKNRTSGDSKPRRKPRE